MMRLKFVEEIESKAGGATDLTSLISYFSFYQTIVFALILLCVTE